MKLLPRHNFLLQRIVFLRTGYRVVFGGHRVALCIFQQVIQSFICCRATATEATAASAATANPRYRCIIRDAEGIETMAHRGQPSWAGRLPVHRLQFRFVILNSPGDEYAPRSVQKNDNVRIHWKEKKIDSKRGKLSYKLR